MALPDFSKLTIREPTTISVKPSSSKGGKPNIHSTKPTPAINKPRKAPRSLVEKSDMGDYSNSQDMSDDSNSEASRSLGSDSPRSDYSNSSGSRSLYSDSPRSGYSNSEESRSDEDDFLDELGETLDLAQESLLQSRADSKSEAFQFLDDNGSGGVYATEEDVYRDIKAVLEFIRTKMQDEDEAEAEAAAAAAAVQRSDNPDDLQRQIDELTKINKQKKAKLAEKYAVNQGKNQEQLDELIPDNIQNDNEQMEPMEPMEQIQEQLSKLNRYRLSHNGSGPRKSLRQGGLTFEPIRIHTLLEMQQPRPELYSQMEAWLEIKNLLDKDKVTAQPSQPKLKKIRTIICNLLKKYDLSRWKSVISPSCERRAPPKSALKLKLDFQSWARLDSEFDESFRKLKDYQNLLEETNSQFICTLEKESVSTTFVQSKLRNGNNYLWMMHTTENNERVTLGFAVASRHFALVGDLYSSVFHLEVICGKSFGYDMFFRVLQHAINKKLTVNGQVEYQYGYFELEALNMKLDATYTKWVEKILSRPEKKQNEVPKFLKGLAGVSIDDYNNELHPRYLDLTAARKYLGLL